MNALKGFTGIAVIMYGEWIIHFAHDLHPHLILDGCRRDDGYSEA